MKWGSSWPHRRLRIAGWSFGATMSNPSVSRCFLVCCSFVLFTGIIAIGWKKVRYAQHSESKSAGVLGTVALDDIRDNPEK